MAHRITVDLPLHARHASTARTVAVSIGADAGFTVDDLEDLRLGVNEVVSVLTDVDAPDDARLVLSFWQGPGEITMTGERHGAPEPLQAADLDVLAERILGHVADEFGIDDDGVFRLRKRIHNGSHA